MAPAWELGEELFCKVSDIRIVTRVGARGKFSSEMMLHVMNVPKMQLQITHWQIESFLNYQNSSSFDGVTVEIISSLRYSLTREMCSTP